MSASDVGIVVATHDRVDDARAGMELLRGAWAESGAFGRLPVVHGFNGNAAWWPQPYLEDELVVVPSERTHYRGAAALLDAGAAALRDGFPHVRYAVMLAGDVWLYDPGWVAHVIAEMRAEGKKLSTAQWRIEPSADRLTASAAPTGLLPTDGLASDFFIVDLPWALDWGMFPLSYNEFLRCYGDLLNYAQEMPFVERYLAGKYLAAIRAESEHAHDGGKDPWGSAGPRRAGQCLRLMHERVIDPQGAHAPTHKGHWPDIGLVTAEDPLVKRRVALDHPELTGPTFDRLRQDANLSWFNQATSSAGNHPEPL
jgi:hypothetical protein